MAAVIDLFSRRLVGWSMSATMTAQLVVNALMMAIWRRDTPDALSYHSDHGVSCSMSRSGNAWDNAAMESFFSSLKTKRTVRTVYCTRNQARADVFDTIEQFYNPHRRHPTIGYPSPMAFDQNAVLA